MIFNPEYESMETGARSALQFARLKNLVEKLYGKVPFYRAKLDAAGVKPKDIRSLADIALLPFTTKDDLRETFPYGLLACPESEVEEIHMSSGTTGVPVVDAYTRNDVEAWGEAMARTLAGAGAATTRYRIATVTDCSPEGSASTTEPRASAPTSSPCPRAIRRSSL